MWKLTPSLTQVVQPPSVQRLMNKLQLHGRKMNIHLTTMDRRAVLTYAVTGLEVSCVEGCHFFRLPEVFTQKTIPAHSSNFPKQADVDRRPHLKVLTLPDLNAGIQLLFGTSVLKAMEPMEVIRSVYDVPYAVRTLRRTINEPLKEGDTLTKNKAIVTVSTNRISVAKLDDLWRQPFRYDFPESKPEEELTMSREDQFLERRVSTKMVEGRYCIGLPLKNSKVCVPNTPL